MPYQVNAFAFIVLIVLVLILVFLIIASIYFYNLMNFKPPTQGEATFLFATAIILAIILFFVAIYALYQIYSYYSMVYEAPKMVELQPITARVVAPQPVVVRPIPVQPVAVQQVEQPLIVTPVPGQVVTAAPSLLNTTYSGVPLDYSQQLALNQGITGQQIAFAG